jgi:hypothetical protein
MAKIIIPTDCTTNLRAFNYILAYTFPLNFSEKNYPRSSLKMEIPVFYP